MHRLPKPRRALAAPLLVALATAACSETIDTTPTARALTEPAPQLAVATAVVTPPGRALAANCFQCHGTDGNASELKIAGESAREIIGELNEMRAKPPGRNIMNVHALGYTPAQITLIANYFASVGR